MSHFHNVREFLGCKVWIKTVKKTDIEGNYVNEDKI